MSDIVKYNTIDMADIVSINGQTISGGGVSAPPSAASGLLYYEAGGFNERLPDANEIYGDSSVSLYAVQLSNKTDIVTLKDGVYHTFMLDSSNNLYSSGYSNTGYLGRVTTTTPAHEFGLSLTNVSKYAPHDNGCWAIKTDGTLWWCGFISQYANSGDTGQSTVQSTNGWKQFGSDTDWIDIDGYPGFPYVFLAVKGSSGSEYLYSCGNNFFGKTGVGTTSGSTKPWTRVKINSTTDWTETIEKISCGYHASMVVTKSGKLFACGDANEGHLGQGTTTDSSYPVQIGTDTNWETPYAKARLEGFAIKTDGSLYGSRRSQYYYNVGPASSNRTYGQIGTDTDYELVHTHESTSSSGAQIVFAKKGGAWYANWGQTLVANSFIGNTSNRSATTDNTWVSMPDFFDGTDISVGINWLHLAYKNGNQSLGEVLTVATAAT